MTRKFPAASKLAMLLAAAALVAVGSASASAQSKQQIRQGRPSLLRGERSQPLYQQGPRTRVYVTTRSWLDAGTEVLPGDRKFQDYAFPSPYGYPTFARENLNRPIDRQPLNPPSDLGGYPTARSRCIESGNRLTKMPGSTGHFCDVRSPRGSAQRRSLPWA